ncbi:MAG TPA: transmembrane domain-containing protein [Candidatus Paceibacterota bacterium]|nr:transmembrane domain-containing protein [Candidatus Paceibacterota bacterium]
MPPYSEPEKPKKESAGATVGIVIIFLLMIAGAFYFWDARQHQKVDTVPYIPGDSSTTTGQ